MMRIQSMLMTAVLGAGSVFVVAGPALAQYTPGYAPPTYAPPGYAPPGYTSNYQPVPVVSHYDYALTDQQIDEIMAPIALYPDPLLANILPASTYLEQVNEVAISLRANPNMDENYIQSQPWPQAVKVLAHYPQLITFMTSRPDWTMALGAVFVEQQAEVMNSIQRLRAQAQAAGSLYTTQQQQVVMDTSYIRIVPADPQVLYVPVYDPQVVFVAGRGPRDAIRFDRGYRTGAFLNFDFDWDHHDIGVGARWDRGRPDHGNDFHPWQHDDHFARPALPPTVVNRFNNDARRGYVPPAPPHPVFTGNDNRDDVRRAQERAQLVRPQPVPQVQRAPVPAAPQRATPVVVPQRPVASPLPGRGGNPPGTPGDRGDRGDGRGGDFRGPQR